MGVMNIGKLITGVIALLVVLAPIMIAVGGCGGDRSMDKTEELEPVEIREYGGADLSSVDDFRENSIRGPQRIDDIASYRLKITGLVDNPKNHTYEDVIDNGVNP